MKTTTNYASALQSAKNELASLRAERYKLDGRIARLEATVRALRTLVEQPVVDPSMGITDGTKAALKLVAPAGLFPTTLRLKLEEAGFDFSRQRNPMASIHTILKRLVEAGYVRMGSAQGRDDAYFFVTDNPKIAKQIRKHKAEMAKSRNSKEDLPF